MKKYDYLIVGAGLYGSIFTYEMNKKGKKCLVKKIKVMMMLKIRRTKN